jgi:ATP-dependent RNA helicase DDX1
MHEHCADATRSPGPCQIDALKMAQVLVFCRTNFDCDNLEAFLIAAGGGKRGRLGAESGKENPYSCCVLAGARSMDERRRNLQGTAAGAKPACAMG